eukprot:5363489-Pyramimonas_sp.AAC.2
MDALAQQSRQLVGLAVPLAEMDLPARPLRLSVVYFRDASKPALFTAHFLNVSTASTGRALCCWTALRLLRDLSNRLGERC